MSTSINVFKPAYKFIKHCQFQYHATTKFLSGDNLT